MVFSSNLMLVFWNRPIDQWIQIFKAVCCIHWFSVGKGKSRSPQQYAFKLKSDLYTRVSSSHISCSITLGATPSFTEFWIADASHGSGPFYPPGYYDHLIRISEKMAKYSYPFVYIKWSISSMHCIIKTHRQKAWDDGVAPGDKVEKPGNVIFISSWAGSLIG